MKIMLLSAEVQVFALFLFLLSFSFLFPFSFYWVGLFNSLLVFGG